jgi:hypothetical protein
VKLFSAEERLAEARGAKVAVFGPSGVGKTSLLGTLNAASLSETLFVDIEGGDLAVAGLKVSSVRPTTWKDCRDLAAVLGGGNPALPPTESYSDAHYQSVIADPMLVALAAYRILFVDSLTAAARLSFKWCEQQPEAFSDRGRKDLRAVYGQHGRTLVAWLNQLQRARSKTVVLVGILERAVDSFNVATWQPQLEGLKAGREMPGIVDQLITYHWVDRGDGKSTRTLVCTSPNAWNFPAKDRSGLLEQFEEPDLGRLLTKLTPPKSPSPGEPS